MLASTYFTTSTRYAVNSHWVLYHITISPVGLEPTFHCGLPISPQRLPVCNLEDYFMHVNHIWHTTNLARL